MVEAAALVVCDPFLVAVAVLEGEGCEVLAVVDLLASTRWTRRGQRGRSGADAAHVGLDRLSQAVEITHAISTPTPRRCRSRHSITKDVMVSWLPCFHDMGMMGFLTSRCSSAPTRGGHADDFLRAP